MRILTCVKPGEFAYSDASAPELKRGYAMVKVKRIGICGTDLHAYEGTQPYFNYPRILGHELALEIIESNKSKMMAQKVPIVTTPIIVENTEIIETNKYPRFF